MNILFLLSSLEPAGSETYCLSLEQVWKGRHQVFWISDQLHYGQSYLSLPVSRKAIPGGVLNTLQVARFVREHGIQMIHSHSRRARWVAGQAATLANIPHVATIHQPPPAHLFSRLFPCLGDQTIAIDENVAGHLQKHFPQSLKHIRLIRNGIDLERFKPPAGSSGREENRVLIVGRLTGGRRRAMRFLFDVLKRSAATLPRTRYQIVGRIPEDRQRAFHEELAELNRAIQPSSIEALGFVPNLISHLQGCRGVIAGGRSAMEALACGRPVIALGERGVVGLCSPETWEEAMRTNFGDHFDATADHFYPAKFIWALRQLLGGGAAPADLEHWGRTQIVKNYNIQTISMEVEKVYTECISRS